MGSWGHDRVWEREVVRRILEGGRAPEAYALYEGAISQETGERAGLLTGVVYYDEVEAAERAAKNRDFRESLRAAQEAAAIRNVERAAEKKARADEARAKRAAEDAKHAAERAKWQKEAEARRGQYELRRPIEIAELVAHTRQENHIMLSRWVCTVCGGKSIIERKNPGYQIQCTSCGKQAWGSHASLWKVLNQ